MTMFAPIAGPENCYAPPEFTQDPLSQKPAEALSIKSLSEYVWMPFEKWRFEAG